MRAGELTTSTFNPQPEENAWLQSAENAVAIYDAAVVDEDGTAYLVKRIDGAAYPASTERLIKAFSPL